MALSKSPFMLRVLMQTVRMVYPKVKQLDTEALATWIKDEDTDNYVLLDVREKDEYEVSHLPEALCIDPEAPANEVMKKINEKTKGLTGSFNVVTYCSVGRRASVMAQRIEDELTKSKWAESSKEKLSLKVHNLEGAIFKWTNEGKPLVDSQEQETKYCHPFHPIYGPLIPRHTRKYEP